MRRHRIFGYFLSAIRCRRGERTVASVSDAPCTTGIRLIEILCEVAEEDLPQEFVVPRMLPPLRSLIADAIC